MLAVTALILLPCPAGAGAFSKAIWGPVTRNGVDQFPLYTKLGVSIVQFDIHWNQVAPRRPDNPTNPSDPAYQWPATISQAIADAKRHHMRVLLQVLSAPAWANGGHTGFGWAPRSAADYAAFMTAAAKRYRSIRLWMVWGEPTRLGNFEPLIAAQPGKPLTAAQRRAPHLYARILDASYAALKRLNRHNVVIGGCTWTLGEIGPLQWIQNLKLPNGKPPRMDMYAHNPFSYTDPNFSAPPSVFGEVQFSDLPRLAGWVDKYLHKGLPLFLSEFTIPTKLDNQFNFSVPADDAGKWVTDALRLSRRWHRIYSLGWVNVYDDPPLTYGGLLTATGVPKPTYKAFMDG